MPLSTEAIQNKPLSGRELIQVALKDLEDVMMHDGAFSPYVAYGRVAYTITVEFQFDNALQNTHKVETRQGGKIGDATDESSFVGKKRTRQIDSANHARGAMGLPIPVQTWEQVEGKSRLVDHQLKYPQEDFPPLPESVDQDVTPQVEAKGKRPKG